MRRFPAAFLLLLVLTPFLRATGINLLDEDWSVATGMARETGRTLYVAFLGDGWSVSSKRFSETVLETPDFRQFAEQYLVYCPVLARSHPKLDKKQTARLQALVIHLDIKTYPTLILIAPDGTEILRHGYRGESVEEYIALLKALLPAGSADN